MGWGRGCVHVCVYEGQVFGSVSTGNLILCQMTQAKARERQVRKHRFMSGRQRLHRWLLDNYLPCPADKAVYHPDSRLLTGALVLL